MTLKKITILLAITCVFTACHRKPISDFTFDKLSYETGEVAHLTNHSKYADTYLWVIGDTVFSKTQDLDIKLGNTLNGVQTIQLIALNKHGESSESTQGVPVKKVYGELTVWSAFADLQVYATGLHYDYLGYTTATYTADPGCNALGCVTRSLIPNTYTVTAEVGTS